MRALVTTLVLLVGVGLTTFCLLRDRPDPAVYQVLSECYQAKQQFTFIAKNGRRMVKGAPYAAAIRKIDSSASPKEFQSAWLNYCDAWAERVKEEKHKSDEFLVELGVAVASTVATGGMSATMAGGALKNGLRTAKEPVQDTHFQWAEVVKASVICNCKVAENIGDF